MELEQIGRLVAELDQGISKENAKIRVHRWGGDDDESCIVATRNGYLRLGIEFL